MVVGIETPSRLARDPALMGRTAGVWRGACTSPLSAVRQISAVTPARGGGPDHLPEDFSEMRRTREPALVGYVRDVPFWTGAQQRCGRLNPLLEHESVGRPPERRFERTREMIGTHRYAFRESLDAAQVIFEVLGNEGSQSLPDTEPRSPTTRRRNLKSLRRETDGFPAWDPKVGARKDAKEPRSAPRPATHQGLSSALT